MKYKFKRTVCGLLSGICLLSAMPSVSAGAVIVRRGDLDGDGQITAADVTLLHGHLLGKEALTGKRAAVADMDDSGVIDAADLTLLKRVSLGLTPSELCMLHDPDEVRMHAPITLLTPTVSSKGTNRLLMIVMDFPDCKFSKEYSAEEIHEISFGEGTGLSPYYPLESVTGYYERSSYDALHMDAEVFRYTAKKGIDNYVYIDYDWNTGAENTRYPDINKVMNEIMENMDDQIDFSRYDIDSDGTIDSVLVSVADTAPDYGWWPCSGEYSDVKRADGTRPGNVIIGNSDPSDVTEYNSTWIHELGHGMGLPDYYKYVNAGDDVGGLNGNAGWEMMDDAYGDMCAFSKLMYGWYRSSEVQIYDGGTKTYYLESSQQAGNCILIPRESPEEFDTFFSEYMMIEYATPNVNNQIIWMYQKPGGIRILHCSAEIGRAAWGKVFKWSNYSPAYDDSNQKQRVIRLVNEAEGGDFFRSGSKIDGSISGFHWYDSMGYQKEETGITVTVEELENDIYAVTVSDQNA